MHAQKILTYFTLALILALSVTGCGQEQGIEPPTAPATSQPITNPTQTPTVPLMPPEFGFITGRVHGQAPPTPPMVVYAVDNTTGACSFTETQQTDGEAPFSLQVPAGSYQVFAFSDIGPFAGYSLDGWTLATVTVASGQTVSDIVVRPPGRFECGAMFGLPASPDGRFAAIEGPPPECQEAVTLPKTEPARIQFAAGTTSAQVPGSLAAGELHPYVLGAMADQEMTVNLYTTSGGAPVPGSAILVIWGLDGTVLISDHADATSWVGKLPSTQDYYIDVKSVAQDAVDYTLEVIIPPATSTGSAAGPEPLPLDVPVGFEFLFGLGEPLMLPPDFAVGEGLPAVQPHVITAEPDEYEISLDYGADCQGAGACHYGSLAGKRVDSTVPVGTRNYPFEAERAQQVALAQGIQGYFIESVCGANCSDALVFWIYDSYQYMLGIKAGPQADVVDLANAAIENSITAAPFGGFQPLDPVSCGDLANAMTEALGVAATTGEAPFEDHVSGQTVTGCHIAVTGTGLNFENIIVVESALASVFQARGWKEDVQYMGGGPGAVVTGYRQADALCMVLAYWEPSEDADCPSDQPIGACELAPEQQLYTITLDCARQ